jgi:hypothetical protein
MPRGIPNAKKDDSGMRYTSMHVPLAYVDSMIAFLIIDPGIQTEP